MIISLKINIRENIKPELGNILFSQILQNVELRKELDLDKKVIFKIFEILLDKYPFIEKKMQKDIYRFIGSSEEIEAIRKKIKNDKEIRNLTLNINIIKEFNKDKKYIHEFYYENY